ncbi:MAG: hypothetical protein SGJ27_03705 [Candidatus Melainabacteria bacterium]|nr:hypothetical protein [Candidatus Melainabacteria bacterium]
MNTRPDSAGALGDARDSANVWRAGQERNDQARWQVPIDGESNRELNRDSNTDLNRDLNRDVNGELSRHLNRDVNDELGHHLNRDVNGALDRHLNRDVNDTRGEMSPVVAALESFRYALTSVADVAIALFVFPLLMVTGPTQPDTAYGAALPIALLAISPLAGWIMTRRGSVSRWNVVTGMARLILAAVVFYSSEFAFLSGGFLAILLAFSWGIRLQENVLVSAAQARSSWLNASVFATPVSAAIGLLNFYSTAQPYLVSGSIALYAISLLVLVISTLVRKGQATTDATRHRSRNLAIPVETLPELAAYESFLSCMAGMICIVPILLLVTDQSTIIPILRKDVFFSLSGWLAGSLSTIFLLARASSFQSASGTSEANSSIQQPGSTTRTGIRLEHLHLLFTALLGALSLCKYTSAAYPLLFLTTATAAAIAVKIASPPTSRLISSAESILSRPAWQPALTMTVLVLATALTYIDLSPKLSALQPIHVDRTLTTTCFIASLIAVFAWSGSRSPILKLVSYLVPVLNPLKQTFPFYLIKNMEITKTILIGWRLNAVIVILTKDVITTNALTKAALNFGNIYALSFTEWLMAREMILERISLGERFLVHDFSDAPIEDISPLPPKSPIGIIEKTEDSIVISDMVPASNASVSSVAR